MAKQSQDTTQQREQLLKQMEKNAAFDGMGRDALLQAADDIGIDKNFAAVLFEDGKHGAIAFYYWQMRITALKQQLLGEKTIIQGVTAKIAHGVKLFLRGDSTECHQGQVALQHACANLLLPSKLPLLAKNIWQVSDVIWHFAGDNSTDHNYYSKRLLLSKALLTSLCFYFQDGSDDKANTESFVDRQLKTIVAAGKKLASGQKIVKNIGDAMVQLLKTLSANSDGLSMKPRKINLRIREGKSASMQNDPIFVTRKLLKNFIKRRVQNFAINI